MYSTAYVCEASLYSVFSSMQNKVSTQESRFMNVTLVGCGLISQIQSCNGYINKRITLFRRSYITVYILRSDQS